MQTGRRANTGSIILAVLIIVSFHIAGLVSKAYGFEILTIGDSITRGTVYVLGDGNGREVGPYQLYLKNYLANEGQPSHVYNWGISGETTFGGLSRINYVLNTHAADFILIMEGANDLYSGISSSTTAANLNAMVARAKAKSVTPILGNITPNTKTAGYDSLIKNSYNPRIVLITGQNGTRLSDQYAAFRPNWAILNRDGLHPNVAGYDLMAQTWRDSILSGGGANIVPNLLLLLLNS